MVLLKWNDDVDNQWCGNMVIWIRQLRGLVKQWSYYAKGCFFKMFALVRKLSHPYRPNSWFPILFYLLVNTNEGFGIHRKSISFFISVITFYESVTPCPTFHLKTFKWLFFNILTWNIFILIINTVLKLLFYDIMATNEFKIWLSTKKYWDFILIIKN